MCRRGIDSTRLPPTHTPQTDSSFRFHLCIVLHMAALGVCPMLKTAARVRTRGYGFTCSSPTLKAERRVTACMQSVNPDKATDWVAVALSTVIAVTVWGIIVHQYLTTGDLSREMMAVGGLFVLLAATTLYGYEKVNKVLELRK